MATEAENRNTILRFMKEVWSEGNLETTDEIVAPDFQFILAFAHLTDREQFKGLLVRNRGIFQDLTYNVDDPVEDVVADDVRGAVFWRMTSKHIGTWRGVPASNKDVTIKGMTFFKFNPDGKIGEARVQNDVMGLMKQIGGITVIYPE